MILVPQGLKALKQEAKQVEVDLRGTSLNLLVTSSLHRHAVTPQRTTARRAVLATSAPGRTAAVPTPG